MGPRSFNRGNRRRGRPSHCSTRLQWGRGLSTAEIPHVDHAQYRTCFNGAAVFQPRKSASAASVTPRPGFNGAAVFQPRKCPASLTRIPMQLQWGRGLSTAEMPGFTADRIQLGRFNGAAVFQPRKWRSQARQADSRVLQWGRGLSTAEMWAGGRGSAVHALQWGRGLSTAEIESGRHAARRRHRFNGAAVFQPRKCGCATARSVLKYASMGPRFSTAEIR